MVGDSVRQPRDLAEVLEDRRRANAITQRWKRQSTAQRMSVLNGTKVEIWESSIHILVRRGDIRIDCSEEMQSQTLSDRRKRRQ